MDDVTKITIDTTATEVQTNSEPTAVATSPEYNGNIDTGAGESSGFDVVSAAIGGLVVGGLGALALGIKKGIDHFSKKAEEKKLFEEWKKQQQLEAKPEEKKEETAEEKKEEPKAEEKKEETKEEPKKK